VIDKLVSKLLARKDYVKVAGSTIVASHRRLSGRAFKDDQVYVKSAEGEANRLIQRFGFGLESRVLDVGCGQGRLAIGLLRTLGDVPYIGIDIDQTSIAWCRDYIERDHPSFKFKHLNAYNERYNPRGRNIGPGFQFEEDRESADVAYLFSVFSHTTERDMRIYLKDFARVLDRNGKVFFTSFVEDNVPNLSINPEHYRLECSGPLHIVRYNRPYLFSILDELGYSILDFTHATEADGQSAIYLEKAI